MVTLDMNAKVVQHVPRIKLDNLTLLSIDMKTKVVQHVPWINLDNLATCAKLSLSKVDDVPKKALQFSAINSDF